MKKFYTLLFTTLLLFSNSNVLAQTGPCTLTGGLVTVTYSAPPIMMNATVNGMSQYTYGWNDGFPVGSSNQKPFYSVWCVTITDIITGCDTTICESCIPNGGVGPCTFIYDPVCGCDGMPYGNPCMAMQQGIFSYTSAIGPNGQTLPCVVPTPSWDCVNGACIDPQTGNGQYLTINDCVLDSCIVMPPAPSWDCVNGACIDPGTGLGPYTSLVTCNSACAITPSWDCDGMGTCTDPGTGAGMYASQASCDNACIVNAVKEQNKNKKLLKITDLLGRETKGFKNDVLFYIYDDGTVEKRIVIE